MSVTLKLAHVAVFDKQMRPVTDLELEDFEVFDNGKAITLTAIEKPRPYAAEREEEKKEEAGAQAAAAGKRRFLLFFDFAFNDGQGLVLSKETALQFIRENLRFPDEAAILSYHARKGMTVHEYFTTDYKRVEEIVEGFGLRKTFGRAAELQDKYSDTIEKQYPDDLHGAFLGKELTRSDSRSKGIFYTPDFRTEEFKKEAYRHDIKNFCVEMGRIGKALGSIEGKKYILFFSKGISDLILYGRRIGGDPNMKDLDDLFGSAAMREVYARMVRNLADADCAVFAINAGKPESRVGPFKTGMQGDISLRELAKGTGGESFGFLEDRSKIMSRIQNLTQYNYVLFFPIKADWDGRFHRVEVRLKNKKGYRLYSSAGYFNPKPFTKYNETERLIHLIDLALGENPYFQVPLSFPAAAVSCYAPRRRVFFLMSVPADLAEALGGRKAEAMLLLFDAKKQLIGFQRREFQVPASSVRPLYFSAGAAPAAGAYEGRMVLRSLETGRGAVTTIPFEVKEPPAAGLVLSSPLLLTSRGDGLFLEMSPEGGEKGEGAALREIYPFDAAGYAPLLGPVEAATRRLFVMIRCAPVEGTLPEAEWAAEIVGAGKTSRTTPLVLQKRTDVWGTAYLLEVPVEGLEPGPTTLRIVGEDRRLWLRSETSASFSVNPPDRR